MMALRKSFYRLYLLGALFNWHHISFSKTSLFEAPSYHPTLQLLINSNEQRTLGQTGILIPIQESNNNLWFIQWESLWGNNETREWTAGVGYRYQLTDWVAGIYGFFDRQLSALDDYYSQVTFGIGLLGKSFEAHINSYMPAFPAKVINTEVTHKIKHTSLIPASRLKQPLGGVDIEIGGRLLPYQSLQEFLTYYHFRGQGIKSINGIRLKGQLHLTNCLALTGETSYDQLRKHNWFISVQLDFRLGASKKITTLSKKMTQIVARDMRVISGCYIESSTIMHQKAQSDHGLQKTHTLVDKSSNFIELKQFIASSAVRNKIQSILVYSPTNICLKPHIDKIKSMDAQLITVPSYDIQGMPPCQCLGDLATFMKHSYWTIASVGQSYRVKIHARGVGGGDREELLNDNTNIFSSLDQPCKPSKPKALGIRPNFNPQFISRKNKKGKDLLELLNNQLNHITNNFTIQIITGIDGIGKTQLAVEYIKQAEADYDGIFWIQASRIPVDYSFYIDTLKIDQLKIKPDLLAQAIHKNLADRHYKKILWVYDNVFNAQIFNTELFNDEIKAIWSQVETQVHVLITSQHQNWGSIVPIELQLFNEANTAAYIEYYFKEGVMPFPKPNKEEIKQLNNLLGGLPLAVTHAVDYIKNQQDGSDISDYIADYEINYKKKTWLRYLAEELDDRGKIIWTIWNITRKSLSKDADLLLQLCCYLANDNIAKLLFTSLWKDKIDDLVKELTKCSLVKLNNDFQNFSVHALWQKMGQLKYGYDSLMAKQAFNIAWLAQASFDAQNPSTYEVVKQWLLHIFSLIEYISEKKLKSQILYSYGNKAYFFNDYLNAKSFLGRVLGLKIQNYGEGHIKVAKTLYSLGSIELKLGNYEAAKGYLGRTLALEAEYYKGDHIAMVDALIEFGNTEFYLNRYESARSYYNRALRLQINYYMEDHIEMARPLIDLSRVELKLKHYKAAKDCLLRVLVLCKQYKSHPAIEANALHNLGIIEFALGHYEAAKDYYVKALALKEQYYGQDHVAIANVLINLGQVEYDLDYYEIAKNYYNRALVLQIQHYGKNHIAVVKTLYNLGNTELKLGHYEDARDYYNQVLTFQTQLHLEGNIEITDTLIGLGIIAYNLGYYEAAMNYYTQALGLQIRYYGRDHFEIAHTLIGLGSIEFDLGCYETAKEYYDQALMLQTRHYGANHIEIAPALGNLGNVTLRLGYYEAAKNYYNQALALQISYYGEKHIELANTLVGLGAIEAYLGHYEEAKDYYTQALTLKTRFYGVGHIQLAAILYNLGNAELYLHHYKTAKNYYDQALAIQIQHYGENHISVANTLISLGTIEVDLGHYEIAKGYLGRALTQYTYYRGAEHINLVEMLVKLGDVYIAQNDINQALIYYQRALTIQEIHYEGNHIKMLDTLKGLIYIYKKLSKPEEAQRYMERAKAIEKA